MDAQGSGVRRFCLRARATGLLAVPGILVMSQAGGAPPLLSFDAVCRCTAWSHKAVGTLGAARSVSALGRGCSWEDSYGRGAGAESAAAELVLTSRPQQQTGCRRLAGPVVCLQHTAFHQAIQHSLGHFRDNMAPALSSAVQTLSCGLVNQ